MLKKLRKKVSRILTPATGRDRRAPRVRPAVEGLEGRLVPATIPVTTFDDIVGNDGKTSLREAISQANLTAVADTILLQAGTYRIKLAGADNTNARGDFDVTKPLTIIGLGAATSNEGIVARYDRYLKPISAL